ncbi:hypothetical protein ZYGR_0AD00940 [Zygosaccharomyces rouxii]|uniref:Spc7 kinetochore protein domain-containing protein n=1 Tax=Zygosaccharomyces rouxii TaxID=4956 RepID=A0A1Q3A5I5_ZYGRO|nr:hypothetical protein ZYGR_0AD00940 [Zygosaccharomyces rouxii]
MAKGILKSSQNEEPQFASGLQLPTSSLSRHEVLENGNNTTSRINTLQLENKINRRVSFAPDVTLHSFDFVPQVKDVKLPRRKEKREEDDEKNPEGEESTELSQAEPGKDSEMTMTQVFKPSKEMEMTDIFRPPHDEPMELTQVRRAPENVDDGFEKMESSQIEHATGNLDDGSQTMELSQIQHATENVDGASEQMELTQVQHATGNLDDASEHMELTQVPRATRNVDGASEQMELTQVPRATGNIADESEKMDLTQVHRIIENVDDESEKMELTQVPSRVHTPPAKRRKTMSSEIEEDDDMELSLMRMSPIALRGTDTKPPLSYSLKKFLDAVGVSFLIDTNFIKSQEAVEFPLTKLPVSLHSHQILSKLYVDMPVLEMNEFVCRELWRRVDQSSVQFQDLENQISSSVPPLLFREYFQSSEDMRRLMNQQLQLVKSFAKLESRKAWYDWRIQHFKGLQDVLLENLGLLQEEKTKLDKDLQRAQKNKEETFSLLQVLRKEVELVRDLPSQVYKKESKLADKLQLEKFRQELKAHKIAFNDSQNLRLQRRSLVAEIESKCKELGELKGKLHQLQQKNKTQVTDYDMTKLRRKLEFLSVLSGIQFKGINNSQLLVKCFDLIELSIDLSLSQSAPQKACSLLNNTEPFYNELLEYVISQLQTSTNFLTDLFLQLRKLIPLIKTYFFLKHLFPLTISTANRTTTIQLMDYDIRTDVKYVYKLSMQELITAVLDENSTVSLSVELAQKNKEIPLDVISARFVSKTGRILSWANLKRIHMTT